MSHYTQAALFAAILILLMGLAGIDDFNEALAHDSMCAENPNTIACRDQQ